MNIELCDYIAIASLIVTIITLIYARSVRKKEVTGGEIEYYINSINIVTKKMEQSKLKIFYDKDEIDYLKLTWIKFINTFHRPITREHINTKDHLRIVFDENSIKPDIKIITDQKLDVIYTYNPKAENEVFIDFHYLNKNDTFMLKCLHTGKENPKILGSLIGFKIIDAKKRNIKKRKINLILITLLAVLLFHGIAAYKEGGFSQVLSFQNLIMAIILGIVIIMFLIGPLEYLKDIKDIE